MEYCDFGDIAFVLTSVFVGICVFNETRVFFSSFRDLADLITVCLERFWKHFEHFRKRSEQLRIISNIFGPFGNDLTSRSCSSNHAVKISVNIIIG